MGYGRFLTVLRGFLWFFCTVFGKFLWFSKLTCEYFFHKTSHGFASFPTEILMKTHKNTCGFCVTFPVVESRWYQHYPDRLVETNDITMVWNTTIPTARKIKANRPNLCLRNRKTNTFFILISAVLLMATLARNMQRSWRNTATCEWG